MSELFSHPTVRQDWQWSAPLTRAALGILPSPYFLDSSKRQQISTQNFHTLSGINLTSPTKFSEKSIEKCLRKWCFSDVMFRRFG